MSVYNRLSRAFFARETKTVARELLGKYLVRITEHGDMVGKIVEVEAYLGPRDKACHSYNWKRTKRTEVMYAKPGTLYVYLIYGMYYCLNVITEKEGMPCAVLIRQLSPIKGVSLMKKNRQGKINKNNSNLLNGPGKLCQALNITKDLFNGKDSCSKDSLLFFAEGEIIDQDLIKLKKRVGIEYAQEDKDLLLRFTLSKG
ncbi:MAG: DNA-3-methyladenine glycosylase [Promethearchaeota archaeon]